MPKPTPDSKIEKARAALVKTAIQNVAFDGFVPRAIEDAAKTLKIAPDLAALAFPNGPKDLLRTWSEELDAEVRAELEAADLSGLKIREKIAKGARLRIEKMAPNKIAARRAAAYLAMPLNGPLGVQLTFHTADAIWRGIGDTSTDFNFYTKRTLLGGVLTSTMLYWFGEEGDELENTWAFLDRHIENVMSIEKARAGIGDFVAKLPDPFKILGGLRYPSKT